MFRTDYSTMLKKLLKNKMSNKENILNEIILHVWTSEVIKNIIIDTINNYKQNDIISIDDNETQKKVQQFISNKYKGKNIEKLQTINNLSIFQLKIVIYDIIWSFIDENVIV